MVKQALGNALQSNLDVDYVISYRFTNEGKPEAIAGFQQLIKALAQVGLATEVRNGDNCSVLVFVKAADEKKFASVIYRSRVKDWLYGVRQAQPDQETQHALTTEPMTDSERLRLVHHMITCDRSEGGANITPGKGVWKNVESLFPLHDHAANKEWLKAWSSETFLKPEDLDKIRDKHGEKIAYYFAFLQSYFAFLLFPAAFGFSCWVLLGHFSMVYAIVNSLWAIVFVEYWKHQEADLAIRWGVKGVMAIQDRRRDFKHEKEMQDPLTGQTVQVFPARTRIARQLLQIPFAILAAAALGTLIATCFGIEIFLSEIYDGPFKSALVFIPTGLLTILVPTISGMLTDVATRLTDYENYETQESYDIAMTQKIFVLNFITSYLPIFLTAFVYVPFASLIVPYLDIFSLTVRPFATHEKQMQAPKSPGVFEINPARLRTQVIYFTVTAQIVNFALETVVPWLKRKGIIKFRKMQSERAAKRGGASPNVDVNDAPEEKAFLARVRNEAELEDYDVTGDLREMCIQFGYLSLFSVVWPLVPISFLINNFIELRSDAFKITVECKRPNPQRTDSIGPWLDSLSFLTWLGSITTAALVYMFSNDGLGPDGTPTDIKGWALLLTIFFSEHIYLVVRLAVRMAMAKVESPGMRQARAEKYMVRRRYLEETMPEDLVEELKPVPFIDITRQSLEEDARETSLRDSNPTTRFWGRQRGWEETSRFGSSLIEMMAPGGDGKKAQ